MADSLSLNREVVRGVLCPDIDISSPAASLLRPAPDVDQLFGRHRRGGSAPHGGHGRGGV